MFSFKRLRPGVYELRFSDSYEMCMTFLRYQEFYESPRYHDRKFTLAEYMSWYVKGQGSVAVVEINDEDVELPYFSYPVGDWGGFNIPAEIIGQVHALGIDDPNHYDSLMLGLYRIMMARDDKAYLIGVQEQDGLDTHEMTHAMYHLDEVYRNKCLTIIHTAPLDLIDTIEQVLRDKGYAEKTLHDEIQAYLTSGTKIFDKEDAAEKLEAYQAGFQQLQADLKKAHDEHYPAFIKDVTPHAQE